MLILGLNEGNEVFVGEEHEMLEGIVSQLREVEGYWPERGLHAPARTGRTGE